MHGWCDLVTSGVTKSNPSRRALFEKSDAVAEGMQVSRGSVLCGDETVFDFQAFVLEAKDRVFEVHEYSWDFDEAFWGGIVPGVDDHRVGAKGLHLWLGGLMVVVHRW
jgi:hypothetical protein